MLHLSRNQPSLWESVLPLELFRMSEELSQVDKLLDDERFFTLFRERFYTRVGRPTIPIATYLRMMYLKYRYQLGYETLVKEVKDSFTYQVLKENSSDTTLLKPGIKGHRRLFRKRMKAVAADRGFYSKENEGWLREGGVKQVSIPVRGRASEERRMEQKRTWFKRLQRFRTGVEARISLLQRKFGLKRSLMRGSPGAEIWVGQGIFAHNLWQAARII